MFKIKLKIKSVSAGPSGRAVQGCGYTEARTYTTQQSGQTPDKKVEIKNITVYRMCEKSPYTQTI
jgi:hypothetical protein